MANPRLIIKVRDKGITMITKDYDNATEQEQNILAGIVMILEEIIQKGKQKATKQEK